MSSSDPFAGLILVSHGYAIIICGLLGGACWVFPLKRIQTLMLNPVQVAEKIEALLMNSNQNAVILYLSFIPLQVMKECTNCDCLYWAWVFNG